MTWSIRNCFTTCSRNMIIMLPKEICIWIKIGFSVQRTDSNLYLSNVNNYAEGQDVLFVLFWGAVQSAIQRCLMCFSLSAKISSYLLSLDFRIHSKGNLLLSGFSTFTYILFLSPFFVVHVGKKKNYNTPWTCFSDTDVLHWN